MGMRCKAARHQAHMKAILILNLYKMMSCIKVQLIKTKVYLYASTSP